MNEVLLQQLEIISRGSSKPEAVAEFYIQLIDNTTVYNGLVVLGFFEDPASARYHGAWKGGLAMHSARVLHHAIRLYPLFCPDTNLQSMVYGALLHDICKAGSYEISTRNVKKNGVWVQEPFYQNKNLVTVGHGAESCRRIEKLGVQLSEGWYQAVRWHMGNFDVSEMDRYALMAAQKEHPEVLLLQTADLMAGIREDI